MTCNTEDWAESYLEELTYHLNGITPGAIDFEFDELAEHGYRLETVREFLALVKLFFELKGDTISPEELNIVEKAKYGDDKVFWEKPVKTEVITEKIDTLLTLTLPV